MYKAEIVADSIMAAGHRITTMLVTMPRIILAEFNTHRMLSRNSASSRAIPFKKMLEAVTKDPFVPMKWMKQHPGMQGTEYLRDDDGEDLGGFVKVSSHQAATNMWLKGCEWAIQTAFMLDTHGVTKQVVNRLLEPFMWQTVLVTATEWENFFALRDDPAAEIHMQHVAHLMLETMNAAEPKLLKDGEWHVPFGNDIDQQEVMNIVTDNGNIMFMFPPIEECRQTTVKIATARCAQTSYTVVGEEGKPLDYKKLIALHDRLAASGHWSPFEHCARAMSYEEYKYCMNGRFTVGKPGGRTEDYIRGPRGWCGNFRGWVQYRKTFKNENRSDDRLVKKEVKNVT